MSVADDRPRHRNWTRWLLLLSLVLNGLLGGYLIGRHTGPTHWRITHAPVVGEPSMPFSLGSLPTPLRDAMRDKLRENREEARVRFRSLRAARAELREAIAADPFDAARLETAFAGLRTAQEALQQDLHAIATEVVGTMSPEERKRLSEWRPERRDRDRRER